MAPATSATLCLVVLAVAMTTMVAGNQNCRVGRFVRTLTVNGRTREVEAGECIVQDSYRIRPKFSGIDATIAEFLANSFQITNQECCCRVDEFIQRTVRFDTTRIKFKDIRSCSCQPC